MSRGVEVKKIKLDFGMRRSILDVFWRREEIWFGRKRVRRAVVWSVIFMG